MKERPKNYEVLVGFPWRGHWTTAGQPLQLLDCEAGALKRAKKIKPKSAEAGIDESDIDLITESDLERITQETEDARE